MPHRSRQSIFEVLLELPWWASVLVAAIVYLSLRFVVPPFFAGHLITAALAHAAQQHAWMFGLFFLIPAPFAAFRQYRRKKLLDMQADLNSIRGLTWQHFEKLIAESFQRMGYSVGERGGSSSDGGIDLVATALNEKVLVQCKHWRARMVGVSTVRELFGVMTAERATGGAVVTSGVFSDDAFAFAANKSIQLIDGRQLEKLVLGVKRASAADVQPAIATVSCPECGSVMVQRTAKQGKFAGSSFWGCSRYPACRGTQQAT